MDGDHHHHREIISTVTKRDLREHRVSGLEKMRWRHIQSAHTDTVQAKMDKREWVGSGDKPATAGTTVPHMEVSTVESRFAPCSPNVRVSTRDVPQHESRCSCGHHGEQPLYCGASTMLVQISARVSRHLVDLIHFQLFQAIWKARLIASVSL